MMCIAEVMDLQVRPHSQDALWKKVMEQRLKQLIMNYR